jgi:hypothetical protein
MEANTVSENVDSISKDAVLYIGADIIATFTTELNL